MGHPDALSARRVMTVEACHAMRVKSVVQLTSHVLPPSGENACSQ